MEQATNARTLSIPKARTTVAAQAKAGARLAYIDFIKMTLTVLVIMVHAAITYGAFGDWTYHDRMTPENELISILLSLFIFVCQSFFMGLFFFFAGYFTPGSFDRKGPARFWQDRLVRIGIPMALYTYFFSRIPNYIDEVANNGMTVSFWQFTARTFWTEADAGPTWFLFALLVFSLGYTLWRMATRALRLDLAWTSRLPAPGTKTLLLVGLTISAAMFAIAQRIAIPQDYDAFGTYNLLLAFFPGYIILFAGGMLAYRNQWLTLMPGKMLKFWGWFSGALILALPIYMVLSGAVDNGIDPLMSGFRWQCAGTCLWFGFACIALSTALTLWMRGRISPQNRITALAAPNTFTVYLIHPLVLVPLTYAMSAIDLPGVTKFGIASALTIGICYLLAEGLRRIPGAKTIL